MNTRTLCILPAGYSRLLTPTFRTAAAFHGVHTHLNNRLLLAIKKTRQIFLENMIYSLSIYLPISLILLQRPAPDPV
jgi:hypothetical protein